MIYLDWAATAPPLPEVINEMGRVAREYYGNPSSLHSLGKQAREFLENARGRCAKALSCRPSELVFTSGGTEANNMIISSFRSRQDRGRLIVTGFEHPSVWEPLQALREDWELKTLHPQGGKILPQRLGEIINDETKGIFIMGVHNETGIVQPLKELVQVVRDQQRRPIHVHSDMVQALGKIPFELSKLGLDSASFSAHKIQGPRGVGLLYQTKKRAGLYTGGNQEGGLRPGTENLPGIAGMIQAIERVHQIEDLRGAASERMEVLIQGILQIPGARLIPSTRPALGEDFSPWILCCAFPPLPGQVLVRALSQEGYALSTGAACSSKNKTPSRGLLSLAEEKSTIASSFRISQGPRTTLQEIQSFLKSLSEQARLLRRALSPH